MCIFGTGTWLERFEKLPQSGNFMLWRAQEVWKTDARTGELRGKEPSIGHGMRQQSDPAARDQQEEFRHIMSEIVSQPLTIPNLLIFFIQVDDKGAGEKRQADVCPRFI